MGFINIEDSSQVKQILRLALLDINDLFGDCKSDGVKLSVFINAILEDLDLFMQGARKFDYIAWDKKHKPIKAKLVIHNGDAKKTRLLEILINGFMEGVKNDSIRIFKS